MIGKTVFDVYAPERAELVHSDDLQVFTGQAVLNREEHLTDSNGGPRLVFDYQSPAARP